MMRNSINYGDIYLIMHAISVTFLSKFGHSTKCQKLFLPLGHHYFIFSFSR